MRRPLDSESLTQSTRKPCWRPPDQSVDAEPSGVPGTVRIPTTDTILHGLFAPAILAVLDAHPQLNFEPDTGNELASLTRRDVDIAVRATKRPPQHLIGKNLGPIRVALYAPRRGTERRFEQVEHGEVDWISPDDALMAQSSVVWRKRHLPKVQSRYLVHSILYLLELIRLDIGVGIVPLFLAQGRKDVVQLTEPLDNCETELWLLARPESRHLRRVSAVYSHLSQAINMPRLAGRSHPCAELNGWTAVVQRVLPFEGLAGAAATGLSRLRRKLS